MIQSWENLVTDGWADGRTDESDFIGRCPSNVDRPKDEKHIGKLFRKNPKIKSVC